MFNQKSGARPNVPRIAVVITDGRSSNPTTTTSAANQARTDHIGMMSIGIGAGVDQTELHAIEIKLLMKSLNSTLTCSLDDLSSD
jgi:uridylate kinase